MKTTYTSSGALFDQSRDYRYRLHREWHRDVTLGTVLWVLLNPSTADADKLDPTLTRCVRSSDYWGYNRVEIVNIFGYRATSPWVMRAARDPVGPENDAHIRQAASEAQLIVCGWGNHGTYLDRAAAVMEILPRQVYCLNVTKAHQPSHPLYLESQLPPKRFR